MKTTMVGIGGIAISRSPGELIKTMALGSCVGVAILTEYPKTVSLIHIALPDSGTSKDKAEKLPGYFADTGLRILLSKFKAIGVNHLKGKIVVKLIGGANVLDAKNVFNIGKRNILAIRKILWKNRLTIKKEDVGGNISRTVWIEYDTGKVFASHPTKGTWEI
ncbi:MAG: chemotaxis protein CheD [bacterium]|nr:chemotaxis protein CheD [bacterium]